MTLDQIITAIGLVGLGGLLKSGFDFLISKRKSKHDSKQSFKETRYKAVILLCYASVYYNREQLTLIINRPDITSKDRLSNELKAEFLNMSLYASDAVIEAMKKFISNDNSKALSNLALSMRKDLYGVKTKFEKNKFDFSM